MQLWVRWAVFAAQFALSHACWLVTCPLAGWIGASVGLGIAALLLAGTGAIGLFAVLRIWPAEAKPFCPTTIQTFHRIIRICAKVTATGQAGRIFMPL